MPRQVQKHCCICSRPVNIAATRSQITLLQALEPSSSAEQELQEAQQLLQQQVARRIGLPALQILISAEHGVGPGGRLWECGTVLAQHIVQHPGRLQAICTLPVSALLAHTHT